MQEPSGTSLVRPSLSQRLQDVTERLAAAQTQADVFAVVLQAALEALGAVSGGVLLLSADGQQLLHATAESQEQHRPIFWQDGPLDSRLPTGEAIARHAPLFFEHAGALTLAYPALDLGPEVVPPVATAILPLFGGERALGVIVLDFWEPHQFTGDEKRFLRTLSAQCGVALGRVRVTADLRQQLRNQAQAADQELQAHEALIAFTEAVGTQTDGTQTDPLELVRQAVGVLQQRFVGSSVVYSEAVYDVWKARVWSNVPSPETLARMTGDLPSPLLFQGLSRTRQPAFVDGRALHGEQGNDVQDSGSAVHLPVIFGPAAQAEAGELRGMLSVRLHQGEQWQERDRRLILAVGRGLNLALERIEQARQQEEERAALDAFVSFAEASALSTEVQTLADRAVEVLCTTLDGVSAVYYLLDGDLWKAAAWSPGFAPEAVATLQAGIAITAPSVAEVAATREVVFVPGWEAGQEGVREAESFGAVALYPLFLVDTPHGLLTMGTQRASDWTDRERRVFRTVGRSLSLALERAEQTQRLELQNAELDARAQALEAFADLTRDLSTQTDRYALIKRAQEVVMSLLPDGYALYYEREGGLWRNSVQTGSLGNAGLQAAIDAGFPYDVPQSLVVPWQTRQPFYQNEYARGSDTDAALVQHVNTVATFRISVNGQGLGVIAFVLFDQRRWTQTDRAVMETVVRSLGLALERFDSIAHLAARTREVAEWRERYEVAVRGSGHMLYDWNPATDMILYGGALTEITGYAAHELTGNLRDWTEHLIHPDDRASFAAEISRVLEHNDEFHLAFRVVRSDGSVRQVQDDGYLIYGEGGQLTRMVGFLKDVTEQKRAAEELHRASRFNELILNNVGEGLMGLDLEGRTSFANPAALTLLGYAAEEVIGLPQHALIHHTRPDGSPYPRRECPIYAAFTDGQVRTVQDEVFWRKDGSSFPVDYTSTPIRNAAGEIEGAVLAFRDISERQRAQQALQQSNEELLRSNAELEQFAYVASHDLQEPLRTVTSFSQLLANRYSGQLDDKADTYIRMITGGTDRMAQLLHDLLNFSRVTSEAQFSSSLDVLALVTQVIQDLNDQIVRTGATIEVGDLPSVLGDPSQLRQVFQNLLGNALKFCGPGQAPRVHVSAELQGDWIKFGVQDNGIGIAPEFFERIFTIFQRLHTRDQYEGNGIGLSITRKIIERHGGRLWPESKVGEGTTFFFTLPAGGVLAPGLE
ncbi:PAS domain S-box protein [Deinococcus oregonensis]|uniref:histidine kinase n=1 Tax=Deinococcus oregonensis TaxID=1805970 RepID=A0ABV6B817_9DEIO